MNYWTEEYWLFMSSYAMVFFGCVTFFLMTAFNMQAGYGRYANSGKFEVSAKIGWFIQEAPSFVLPLIAATNASNWINSAVLSLLVIHYAQRTFIFPLLLNNPKPSPIYIIAMAFGFCMWNGWLQGTWHARHVVYGRHHFEDPITILGVIIFFAGMAINIHSDHILRTLRKPGDTGYKIPRGGLFEYVSGANFFGEIIEWSGYALVARTFPAVAFAIFTFCNIGPRALQHHSWYKEKFEDYPAERKALIPFVL